MVHVPPADAQILSVHAVDGLKALLSHKIPLIILGALQWVGPVCGGEAVHAVGLLCSPKSVNLRLDLCAACGDLLTGDDGPDAIAIVI